MQIFFLFPPFPHPGETGTSDLAKIQSPEKGIFGDLTVSNTAPLQGLRCIFPTRGCRQRDYCNQGAVQRSTPHQQHVWHPSSTCVGSIDSESTRTEIQPGQERRLFCSYFNFCSPPAPGLKRDMFCWKLDQDALFPFPLSLNCHGERWLSLKQIEDWNSKFLL